MASDLRQRLGGVGEQLAVDHLRRLGYEIVERNYRTRWGEIDVIAARGRVLVFCEVKARRAGGAAGGPFDAVGPAKQAQVRRMAGGWLATRRERPYAAQIRFDVIGVTVDRGGRLVSLEHLEGAF